MLSERARADWQAFVESGGEASLDRDLLHAFLIGIHRRGEKLHAHDLKVLLDEAALPLDVQEGLIAFVEPALALLTAYQRRLAQEDEICDDVILEDDEGYEVRPGDLIL